MDKHAWGVIERKMKRTAEALRKNRFEACVVKDRNELLEQLKERMPAGISCSAGGSMTLFEAGVIDFLNKGDFRYLDRYAQDADLKQVFHDALSCDVYLMSTNAVTEDGKLYNMDGNGNRVAALVYGPDKVIVVAGYNKIVRNVEAARARNRQTAAPANALRLNKTELPCYHTGECADCNCPTRLCSAELVTHSLQNPGRICVLLVGEELGY